MSYLSDSGFENIFYPKGNYDCHNSDKINNLLKSKPYIVLKEDDRN